MKPVDQIVFEDGKGDCLRGCVASIIEWPVESVPNFAEDGSYVLGAIEWLKKHGYSTVRVDWSGDGFAHSEYLSSSGPTPIYCILGGKSPRATPEKRKMHAVVGRANGWSFKIDHDPHPSREGIVGEPDFAMWIFQPHSKPAEVPVKEDPKL